MKTALVTITNGKQTGTIWMEEGSVCHAEMQDFRGEAAFYQMVRWNEGEFSIEHGVSSKVRSVDADPMFLLMEGLRLLDEEGDPERVGPAVHA